MEKSPQDYETELKSLHTDINNRISEFNFQRNLFVEECLNYILGITDEYERLKYITDMLCVHPAYLYEFDSTDSYGFTCDPLEIDELVKVCKKCFPGFKVTWSDAEDCGGQFPEINLVREKSKETLEKLQNRLTILMKEQDENNQQRSKLLMEENLLRSLIHSRY